jgi:hypothetical protein
MIESSSRHHTHKGLPTRTRTQSLRATTQGTPCVQTIGLVFVRSVLAKLNACLPDCDCTAARTQQAREEGPKTRVITHRQSHRRCPSSVRLLLRAQTAAVGC